MDRAIFFSIVIPTYNRGHLIDKTIESALNQTYPHYEILLIDDGSTDNTKEVVASIKDPRLKYFFKENAERGAARNYGTSVSHGDYINFFDSDDLLLPNHLETAIKVINENQKPEIFRLGYEMVSEDFHLLESFQYIKGNLNLRLIKDGNFLSCHGVFLRKDIAIHFPFIEDRNLAGSEDHELWIRLASRYKIYQAPVVTSYIINHQSRSVLTVNMDKLIERLRLFTFYVKADDNFDKVFGKYEHLLEAQANTYISLHLALIRTERSAALKYLWKGFVGRPGIVFKRRFWAIIKHIAISFFRSEKRGVAFSSADIKNDGQELSGLAIAKEIKNIPPGYLLFSVIIPTYNRANFITKTVESVVNQEYRNYEIIIVDDGSVDETESVVAGLKYDNLHYYKIPNSERAYARNYGISKAKGDYITFLDSDDMLFTNYFSNAYKALVKYSHPDFFHLAYESKSAETGKTIKKYIVENDDILSLIRGNPLSCLGIFLKRSITDVYKFNEDRDLSGSEDWELWLRISSRFGMKTDAHVSAALMIHEARSVLDPQNNKLPQRKILALKYAFDDENVKRHFGKYRAAMEAYCNSYVALHMVLAKHNAEAFKFLNKSIKAYWPAVIERRTLAILKYALLNFMKLR